MSGGRASWPEQSQSPNMMDNNYDPALNTAWMDERQVNDMYNQRGYVVHPHLSHHVRTPSTGYGMGIPAGGDLGIMYGQPSMLPPATQAALEQYRLYPQPWPQAQLGRPPATSITERLVSRAPTSSGPPQPTRSTLRFADLEPWMDVNYFNEVCGSMGWENVILKIPNLGQPHGGGGNKLQPNNPGYVFMTFATADVATAALAACRPQKSAKLMPNSQRPFNVVWATVPTSPPRGMTPGEPEVSKDQRMMAGLFATGIFSILNPTPSKPPPEESSPNASGVNRTPEYSIFVGDLAPETTNADLTAVFRDPILGLRLDREPKYVAPFSSCKSSKIMVDQTTGLSKGYGFVRFGSASDASRALIEMQGLYCLSRPMRISQATAKARTQGNSPSDGAARTYGPYGSDFDSPSAYNRVVPISAAVAPLVRPMSGHRDLAISTAPNGQGQPQTLQNEASPTSPSPPLGNVNHNTSNQADGTSSDPLEMLPVETKEALAGLNIDMNVLASLLRLAAKPSGTVVQEANSHSGRDAVGPGSQSAPATNQQFSPGDTQLAHHRGSLPGTMPSTRTATTSLSAPARPITITPGTMPTSQQRASARALLATMVGANGAVQNITDPYNTTVFVGGLSGLISEDTLRSFFGEFGEIHYVKIPPGKGCGFVQFVKKADAEAAIEGLQGYPIGGCRVRLSWGRSQSDKAAQAAAQAAQLGINLGQLGSLQSLSEDHTAQILQSLGISAGEAQDAGSGQARGAYVQASSSPQYNIGGTTETYVDHNLGLPTSSSTNAGNDLNDLGPQIPRSQTFPSFAPFGADAYSNPAMVASRSVAGINALQSAQLQGRPQLPSQGSRGNVNQHVDNYQNGTGGYTYFEQGQMGPYARHGEYQPNDLNRQERSGSDSTNGANRTDPITVPSHECGPTDDVYDMSRGFAAMKFGRDGTDEYNHDAGDYHQQVNGTYMPIMNS